MLKVICFYGVDEKLAGQLNFLAKAALLSLLLPSLLNFDPILQEKESLWYQNKKKVKRHTNYPTAAVLQDNALQCDFRGSWQLKKGFKNALDPPLPWFSSPLGSLSSFGFWAHCLQPLRSASGWLRNDFGLVATKFCPTIALFGPSPNLTFAPTLV